MSQPSHAPRYPVRVTDPPISIGTLPELLPRNMGHGGIAYFRTLLIPLFCEDTFWRHYKANKAAWAARGFTMGGKEEQTGAWRINQFLAGTPGAHYLTANGADILDRITGVREELKQGEIILPGPAITLPELEPFTVSKLRPFQVEPTQQMVRALLNGPEEHGYPGAGNLSGTGTGKTYMSIGAFMEFTRVHPSRTALVILCPKAAVAEWEMGLRHFGIDPRKVIIESYEATRGGWRHHIARPDPSNGLFSWQDPTRVFLIMDEGHVVRHPDTLTFKLCASAIIRKIPLIIASATLATSPLEFRFAGRIMGLHSGGKDWERFLLDHGCTKGRTEWNWKPNQRDMRRIFDKLFPFRACRITAEDAGADMPETTIEVLRLSPIDRIKVLDDARKELDYISRLRYSGAEGKVIAAKERSQYMTQRMAEEMAMVPEIAAAMKRDLADGFSVVAFMNFDSSREALGKALNRREGLHGKVNPALRKRFVEDFQANRIRCLVNNLKAGSASVSLHDLDGNFPRKAYIVVNDEAIAMRQATGRVARVYGKSASFQFICCMAGGVTEEMVKRQNAKQMRINTLNDGRSTAFIRRI